MLNVANYFASFPWSAQNKEQIWASPDSVRVPPRGSEFPSMTLVPWYMPTTPPQLLLSRCFLSPTLAFLSPLRLSQTEQLAFSPLLTSNTLLASHELSLEGMFLLHSK